MAKRVAGVRGERSRQSALLTQASSVPFIGDVCFAFLPLHLAVGRGEDAQGLQAEGAGKEGL